MGRELWGQNNYKGGTVWHCGEGTMVALWGGDYQGGTVGTVAVCIKAGLWGKVYIGIMPILPAIMS